MAVYAELLFRIFEAGPPTPAKFSSEIHRVRLSEMGIAVHSKFDGAVTLRSNKPSVLLFSSVGMRRQLLFSPVSIQSII